MIKTKRKVVKMKRIALSLMTIAVVATMAASATNAYFSDTKIVANNTFSTGTVTLGEVYNMPINISGLYPGAEKSSDLVAVNYTGSLKGDLYFGFKEVPGHANFTNYIKFQVEVLDSNGNHVDWVYPTWQEALYPYTDWTKAASGLNQNDWARYKVYVQMGTDTPNSLQGKTAYADIVFYAIQEGATPTGDPSSL